MNQPGLRKWLLLSLFLFFTANSMAQKGSPVLVPITPLAVTTHSPIVGSFNQQHFFTEQSGQYQDVALADLHGKTLAGFEGFTAPVLFTKNGLLFLQRKESRLSHEEEEAFEHKGIPEEEIERRRHVTEQSVSLEWVGANPAVEIKLEDKVGSYSTYGSMPGKAAHYRSIRYNNLYAGIDLIYTLQPAATNGFEYSLIIHPGADPSLIRMRYGGDISKLKVDEHGDLMVKSALDIMKQSGLKVFTTEGSTRYSASVNPLVESAFAIEGDEVRVNITGNYDHSKLLVIDPFVSSTAAALTGASVGVAKDVDYDYAGNVYVSGGGNGTVYQLAKFDATGVLQWSFNGTVNNPQWSFGPYFGGWVVEKTTGNIYLGQGFDFLTGFIVVRINTTGLYDNYITNGNPNFRENWKMIWNCNNGLPQIIVAGGGTNSNINLGLLSPPSVIPTAANITGIADIAFQDMADMVIDPLTNSMYTIYASGSVPALNNSIYKHDQPYSAATKAWNVPSGYTVLQEANNRPYLGAGLNDNSANLLAINPSYLFYWDGRNLTAFNKATGAVAGSPIITGNTPLAQGGIIADACNNVFVGSTNGIIKVYNFNGTVFNDAAAADITIPGFGSNAVFDLAYNETLKLLYASGNGFVASIDVSGYCASTVYTLSAGTNCTIASAVVTLAPAPPVGSTITYLLYTGSTFISSNTNGTFNALQPGVTYTVVATINQACSGTQSTISFVMPGPSIGIAQSAATCGASTGSITATGSGTIAPYTYSKDGVNFVASGNFSGLAGGVYNITVKDANGCITATPVTVTNSNGPVLSTTQTNADCGNSNATITATAAGGSVPYQFSSDAGLTFHSSGFFTGLMAGTYTVMVKDNSGCTNAGLVTLTSSSLPSINAIPAAATCNNNNGLINVFGSGGKAPYLYSIDQNTFQGVNTFANLSPGNYTVTVKDDNGCRLSTNITINNTPAPSVSATASQAACANTNGAITATGTGGLAPLQYSINNGPFQQSNIFNGLAAGFYSIAVQDVAGCLGSTSVIVASASAGPVVTASALPSACNINNGSIAASAFSGVAPYQYSLDNLTYQPGTNFSGLAAGNYVVFAKDNLNCVSTFSLVVPPTSGPVLTVAFTASSCAVNNGTITVTASGGTGALSYSIDGVNFVPGNTFTGLAPNIYTVTVKDANGCARFNTITLPNVSGLSLTASSIASSCGGNTGTVTGNAIGGILPLQYSLDAVNYQAANAFNGMAPGNYTVFVKDANGCVVSKAVAVASIAAPNLVLNKLDASCGTASGSVLAIGTNGVAPLTYKIDAGAFSAINAFVNLAAGAHTVVVKDAGGCTTSQSITIVNSANASAPTDVTFTLRNAFPCTGGVVKIKNLKGVPTGGGNHYQFSLDFGAYTGSNTFTGVPPGNHVVTALNDNGCTFSKIAVIGTGLPATATATAVGTACNTTNGSITINGVGGSVPYHASIDGASVWQTFFPPGANSFTFTNLAPGTHTITMADDADFTAGTPDIPGACLTSISVVVPTIGGPVVSTLKFDGTCALNDGSITASGTGIAPFTFNINGGAYQPSGLFNNLGNGQYSINLKDGNGCISSTNVSIVNPSGPVITATAVATSCNLNNGSISATATNGVGTVQYSIDGFTFQPSGNFTNLAPGVYTVYAKDANGCYHSIPVTVSATVLPRVTAFTIAASCNNLDGSVFVTASGGAAPYQFSIDALNYQSSTTFSGFGAGVHTVTIKDVRGCTNTTSVVLGNIGAPAFTNTAALATCGNNNGSTTITASGGQVPYTYSSDGINYQPGNLITGLAPGNNIISVKDANGCILPKSIVVGAAAGPQSLNALIADASCGFNNGSVTLLATGGTAPLQYSSDGVNFQPGNLLLGLPAGSYTVYVKDANSCFKTLPVVMKSLAAPLISTVVPSPATCVVHDGSITANAIGGTGALGYSIDGVSFQASNIFTTLGANTYSVIVKDAKGCADTVNNVSITALSNVVSSAVAVNPTCGNADGVITLTGASGSAPYQYSSDGINFQAGNVLNGLLAGNYNAVVKDANGCTSIESVTLVAPSANPKTWLGVNSDWQDPVNWCGGVPLISQNVLIPSGLSNYPIIANGTGYAKNITIQPGASVVVLAAIQVADSIQNFGQFNAVQGTVELIGTIKQFIAGSYFKEHTIHRLIISNSSATGVEVSNAPNDTLKISRALAFGFDDAVLTTGDQITLLSSDTATASLGTIKENADGSPRVTINGRMIVERYYPRKRAWRLITAPFKNDAVAPSINSAWQEAANPPSVTGIGNPDPHPTYGTHITGPYVAATAYAPLVTASGFDQSPQNNSSLKYYDHATNGYKAVTNTFTSKVTDRQGYLIFVRGDRSYDISTTSNVMNPASTVLRAIGHVNAGKIAVPADTGLQVIGNPYPSAIRFDDSMFAQNAAIMKNSSFWLWDPLRGTARNSPVNVGGWIPIVYAGNGVYLSTYDPAQSVAGLDSAHAFDVDGSIQSGAAIMIDNKATAAGNFVLHEYSKMEGSNNFLFRPAGNPSMALRTNLFRTDANLQPLYWADGTMIVCNDDFQNTVDWNEDIRKVYSATENLCINQAGNKIAIDRRQGFMAGDTIWYDVSKLKAGNYRFEIYFDHPLLTGLQAIFEDAATGKQTPVSLSSHTLVDVEVTTDVATLAANRFRIVFRALTILPLMQLAFDGWQQEGKVALLWTVQHQEEVDKFVVEKSSNGSSFTEMSTVLPALVNATGNVYQAWDAYPAAGNNFYRIRIMRQDGSSSYSRTVMVAVMPGVAFLQVSPNPVQQGNIQLLMQQVSSGKYKYELYDAAGKMVLKGQLLHEGGTKAYRLNAPARLPAGMYKLAVAGKMLKRTVLAVLVTD